MKVLKSELDYTGGGIWCTWGELDDGTIFESCDNEGFTIFTHSILDQIENLKKEWCDDDLTIYDIYGTDEAESCVLRYTDDTSKESFAIWSQIYQQHKDDCVDIDWLIDDLYDLHGLGSEKPIKVTLSLTKSQLELLNGVLAKVSIEYREMYEDEADRGVAPKDLEKTNRMVNSMEAIFSEVHDEYRNNCESEVEK